MMSYCILLDVRQKDGYHVLTFSGTLASCREVEHDPGTSWSLPKSEWKKMHVEEKTLTGPYGHAFAGEIATLERINDAGGEP